MGRRTYTNVCSKPRAYSAVLLFGVVNTLALLVFLMRSHVPWTMNYRLAFFNSSDLWLSSYTSSPPLCQNDVITNTSGKNESSHGRHEAGTNSLSLCNSTSLEDVMRRTTSSGAAVIKRTPSENVNTSSGTSAVANTTSSKQVDVIEADPVQNIHNDSGMVLAAAVFGPGQPMTALGKVVNPRANATPPWSRDETKDPCPVVPPNLVGRLAVNLSSSPPEPNQTVALNPGLEPGGHYHPPHCRARHRVAIVVPYRNRFLHLNALLHHLHPILQRQQLDYFILVVELALPTTFNRGMLLNIGAVEALGLWDVKCFILHDVDLLPEDDRNLYICPENPRHMSASVDKFNYQLPYASIFGGVSAIAKEQFSKVNGYSNLYFGWGGEDDDLYSRITTVGKLRISRYPMSIARYRMFKHDTDASNPINPNRSKLVISWKGRQPTDGLNSLLYEVKNVEFRPGYTWILVSVDKDKVMKAYNPH